MVFNVHVVLSAELALLYQVLHVYVPLILTSTLVVFASPLRCVQYHVYSLVTFSHQEEYVFAIQLLELFAMTKILCNVIVHLVTTKKVIIASLMQTVRIHVQD